MIPQLLPVRFLLNPAARPDLPYTDAERGVLSLMAHQEAFQEISAWPGYKPTPLRPLPALAEALGLRAIWYKDEGTRMGLNSFKALGGTYGVFRVLEKELAEKGVQEISSQDLREGMHGGLVGDVTVTCASAGNHGQAVARGANLFGCRCVVFLPQGTGARRVQAIEALGAKVRPVAGDYDEAVRVAAAVARDEGWLVVSDTAYPGYEEVPRHIMQGYTVIVRELLEQLPVQEMPTHVFLQGGVGGLAAAVTAHLWEALGPQRPLVVVVEPAEADCLLESALAGGPRPSRGSLDTIMSCLACREPSLLAWKILKGGANAFLTVPDYAAQETVALLAGGFRGDPRIGSQASGVAGLTGLIASTFEPTLSNPLGLGDNSRVIIIGSEGPTQGGMNE